MNKLFIQMIFKVPQDVEQTQDGVVKRFDSFHDTAKCSKPQDFLETREESDAGTIVSILLDMDIILTASTQKSCHARKSIMGFQRKSELSQCIILF